MLDAAAPDHVDAVRRHFMDHLSRTQIRNLAPAFAAVQRGRERQERPPPPTVCLSRGGPGPIAATRRKKMLR